MGKHLMKWIQQLFQDHTGQADEIATLAIIGFLTFVGCEIYSVVAVSGYKFDPQTFGIGFGAALGAVATGMGIKTGQEKK